jgi:hypothetical protein
VVTTVADLNLDTVVANQANVVTMRERWAERVGPSHHVAADLQQALVRSQRDVPALIAEVRRLRGRIEQAWDEGAEFAVGYATAPLYENPYRSGKRP